MKAALFYTGNDIRVTEVPDPQPGPGQVLVRVRAAGICGTDLHFYRSGQLRMPERAPTILGHELAGEVIATGSGVDDLEPGLRVAVEPLVGCGTCDFCRSGAYNLCHNLKVIGFYYPGGFAEMTTAPREKIFPLPSSVPMDAAGIVDVYACAIHALHRAPIDKADDVAIIGGGAIGLATAQVARSWGARRVYVVATHQHQQKAARSIGVDAVIDPKQVDPIAAIRNLTQGKGAGLVFEAVGGSGNTLEMAMNVTARSGTVCVLGLFGHVVGLPVDLGFFEELKLVWSCRYGHWKGEPEFKQAIDMIAEGKVDPTILITHVYPLGEVHAAFEAAVGKSSSKAIKVVIQP
jgi:2-desacetyl-2-hydroxyethyl bacteriochlorophyllide A dehydrogenase